MTALVLGMSAVQLPAQEVSLYKRGSTYDENTMPPSPEPASVVKYAGVPFSHSSGLAEYDVPFHTLSGHELNIPIGLHYVSGGIRLDEIAGVAGLGWTLQAGGCVTRTVVDMPDEYSSALLTHQMPSGSLLTDLEAMTESTSATNYLRDLLWHRIDSSLDRYSYSVCGLSGTFVITDDGNVFQLSGDGVEITYTTASDGSVDTFTITGPDGTVYVLSEKETATHLGRGTAEFTPTSGEPDRWSATTAWHITQMRSRSGMETAHFTYSVPTGWNSSVYSISRSVSITVGSSGNIPSQGTSSTYVYKTHGTKVLTSISLCGQTATFSYATGTGSSSRTSYGAQQNFPFRLTGISVNAAGNPSELARLEVLTARDAYDGRIVLNGLRLYRGNTLDDKWAFTYRGVGRAVSHGSQDWYGFYNGENEFTDSGTHDICPYEYSQTVGLMITNGYPDPEYADYMSLKTADHDGAVATFAYEGNTITSGSDTYHLGVRVKTISVSDGMRIAYVRRFTYESPAASGPYVPVPDMYTIVNLSTRPSDTAELCDWSYSFHDTPVDIGTSIRDTRVYYGKVTEDVYERFLETTPASVRTVYRYDTSDMVPGNYVTTSRFPSEWRQYYDSMLLTPPFCSPWTGIRDGYLENKVMASPLLTRREDYACEDGTYTLVSSIDYTYDTAFRGSVLVDYRASQVAERNLTAVIFDYDNIYHFPVYALSWSGRHPVKEVHTGYHSSGNDVTEINTVYVARPGMGSPVRVQSVSTQEAGVTRMTMFTYADTWAGATGWVSDLRNQRALDMPLVQTLRYAYGSPSDSEDIRKTETQYGWFSIDGTLRLLPSVHKETNLGTESWRETVLSRDCMGNISSFQEKGEPQTVVIWGYGGQYPVAIINNATMTSVTSAMGGQAVIDALTEAESPSSAQKTALSGLRTSLSGAHVTTYEYIPGIGMSSRTDPAGMTVTYEYTTAGKLSCVRDHEGKKVEEHEYSLMSDGNRRRYMKSRVFRSDNGQQYAEDVIWWDAFGRRTQGISVSASGDGSDLVTAYGQDFMMHDDVKTWLPYPAQNTEGTFQTGAENASAAYHGSSLAYHHKRYETSARDRVISDALPGYAENHETSYETDVVTGFPVMVWNENAIVSSGTYPAGCIIVARTTDADGRIISTFSDHTGKTLGTSYGTDSPTYYIYDRYDRLRAVAGSGIQTSDTLDMWRYSYDALGRLASKGVPGSVREHYTYDTEDRIETISRNGVLREMEYDSFNRVVKVYVTRPGGTRTLLEQHTYDVYPAGVTGASPKGMKTASRIAQIGSDGNVSGYADISWSYDERKRPVQTVVRYGDAGVLSESTEYGFSGEVTSRTFAYTRGSDTDRMTLSYAYDVRGRMTTETATLDPSSGTSSSATLTHSYDALGRLSGTTAEVQGGIQVVTEQDYTLQGWIESLEVSVNEAVLFFQSLGYDGTDVLSGTVPLHTGIVTMKDEAWTSGGGAASTRTEGYAYDHVGRLSKEVLSEEIISYSYDYRGNILSVTGGTSPGTYVHDGYRLTSAQVPQTASFTHDALGRMTYDGLTGQSTAYNDLDLVRNISRNGTTLANYSYLSDGTKLEAVDGNGGGLVYRGPFVYRKSPGGSSLTLESVSFGGGRLAAGRVLLHVRDYLGSVRAVIDGSTGAAYKASDYSAFGNESAASSVQTSAVPSGMTLREAYTGKEDQTPDFGTSYTDFGARQYSPTLRRWMVPDPMSEKYYGTSPYAFCNNNPVNFVDPDGKNPIYNRFGTLLGTDDGGLHGKALFMDDSEFSQGMKQDEALLYDKGVDFLENEESMDLFQTNYVSLPKRPDWDGKITLEEANQWYRNGNGQPLFVDINKINLPTSMISKKSSIGQKQVVNTLFGSIRDGIVYGAITVKYYPNNGVRAFSDNYGFEMKTPWLKHVGRNIETIIGSMVAGQGMPYDIHIYGIKYLSDDTHE